MSDGSTSPEMLVQYAIDAGLDFIAVTDHDTMAGAQIAFNLGKRKGLKVIPGVEVSTYDSKTGRNVHLLCYMPKKTEKLEKLINGTLKNRNEAIKGVIEEISKHYPITFEDVRRAAGNAQCIYRQHVARALMERGYTDAIFSDLYGKAFGEISYKVDFPEVREAADIINQSGGICCLAHPGRYDSLELAWELAETGKIQAIELSHPANSESDREEIQKIIKKYWLVPLGGTDYHGYYSGHPHPLGTCTTPGEALDALLKVREELNK
jgi:predicted metal-dependent phosphoesterase TrpH